MASASFGRKACELVREIAESEAGRLPPYNQDLMRAIADQCADHDALLKTLAREFNEMNDAEDDDGADATAREDEEGIAAHGDVRASSGARERRANRGGESKTRETRARRIERASERATNERLTAFASRAGDIAE